MKISLAMPELLKIAKKNGLKLSKLKDFNKAFSILQTKQEVAICKQHH